MLRKLLWTLATLVALVVLALVGAFTYALTATGQRQLAGLIERQLSGPGQQAEVAGLSLQLPFDLRLATFRLRDGQGVWLEVEDALVVLAPAALLHAEVLITDLGARRVALDRLPSAATEPVPKEPFSLPRLPELPRTLPSVTLARMHVDVLELGEPVLGQAATFALDGSAGTGPQGSSAELRLDLRRTDAPTAELSAVAGLDLAAGNLHLSVQGQETGGLLGQLTEHPEAGALRLSLAGDGPLSDWRGHLAVEAERLAKLDLAVDLAYAAERHVSLSGSLNAEPGALPTELAAIVGSHAELTLRAGEAGLQRFALQELGLRAGGLSLTGSGDADLGSNIVNGTMTLQVPDLQHFAGIAGVPLEGISRVALSASGAALQPDIHIVLDTNGLRADTVTTNDLKVTADVAFTEALGQGPVALKATGQVEANGLAINGRILGDQGRLTADLAGDLPARGQARLERLDIRSSLVELNAHGAVDRDSLAGTARLDATVPQLSAVAAALGIDAAATPPPSGVFRLGADVTLAEQARRIVLALDGAASDVVGLPPGLQDLVGAAPTLQLHATVEPGRTATVDSFAVVGTGLRLDGEPTFGFADQSLGGELRLAVPDLKPLSSLIGQPLAGRFDLRTVLGGTVPVPAIQVEGTADAVALAGQAFDRLNLVADAKGPVETLAGTVKLTAERATSRLALSTGYALAAQRLDLTGITLDGPSTRLVGDLQLGLERPLVSGKLAGQVGDMAALAPWIGQRLTGLAKLDLQLETPQARQDAVVKLAVTTLGGDFGSLRTVTLDARVRDALGSAALDANLAAEGLAVPDLAVDRINVDASGRLADLAVKLSALGKQGDQLFDLNAVAGLDLPGPRKTIRLTSLDGTLLGQKLRLMQPMTVALEGAAYDVDQLDLRFGVARAQGNFHMNQQRVRGGLVLNELALAALEPFGVPPLAGTARATLDLAGSPKAPEVNLKLDLGQLALDPAARTRVDSSLQGTLGNGRLEASLSAQGLGVKPFAASAGVPVIFSLSPFAFTLNDGVPLAARLDGPVDLARVASFAALDGVQLRGVLQLALDVGGTLSGPQLGGTMALADGSVQEVTSGLSLQALTLRARGAGNRLYIDEFSGTDPTGGKLAASGSLGLPPGGGLTYDVAVNAAAARVLQSELGTVVISGAVAATGALDQAAVHGKLTVDRADILIPDQTGGPTVPVISVTEVNRAGGVVAQPRPPGPPFALSFDVATDIPSRFFVRGRGLDSEWGGALQLKGDLADPQVLGELKVLRGIFDLLDRRFTISRGTVEFVGTRPPVPMIDLEASARTVDVTVTVTLKGPAANPKLTLSSDPTLPQDEILSRLLFGTSVARVTPVQGLRLAAAAQQLQGGGLVSDTLTTLRRAAGLDTLDVQSGETAQESTARAGKYISDNVYLEVQRGVADGSGKASVRVDLTPQLSVGTSVNEQSQTGVGLQWKYDY
ncbi:MAG: translocation/assembly module TamB domain-containing protein [Geminicoccaceae bacterium]